MKNKEQIIREYIQGYNQFDIAQMLACLDEQIEFKDIQDNRTVINLLGKSAFEKQAQMSQEYFSSRQQTIKSIDMDSNQNYIVNIAFKAILKIDLPNGLRKGQEINLDGKSIFEFKKNRIIRLTDII
ncbi:nuclear transport factor 2-like protein [Myroides sp. LJL119]